MSDDQVLSLFEPKTDFVMKLDILALGWIYYLFLFYVDKTTENTFKLFVILSIAFVFLTMVPLPFLHKSVGKFLDNANLKTVPWFEKHKQGFVIAWFLLFYFGIFVILIWIDAFVYALFYILYFVPPVGIVFYLVIKSRH